MTTTTAAAPALAPTPSAAWIDDWRPEDPEFWETTGKRVARRNLFFSIFSEHIGFSIWSLWSVLVLFLRARCSASTRPASSCSPPCRPRSARSCGCRTRSPSPSSAAATGRSSAPLLLLVPTHRRRDRAASPASRTRRCWSSPALAGVGGGNFASSMANINAFYPRPAQGLGARPQRRRRQPRRRRRAAGRPAGAGDRRRGHPRLILGVYIPLIVVAALGAALVMDNLTHGAQRQRAPCATPPREPHTWIIVAPLHRHVRLVHRLRLRLRPGAADPVRRILRHAVGTPRT